MKKNAKNKRSRNKQPAAIELSESIDNGTDAERSDLDADTISIDTSSSAWTIPLPPTRSPARRHHSRRLKPLYESNANTKTPLLRLVRRQQHHDKKNRDGNERMHQNSLDGYGNDGIEQGGSLPTNRLFGDSDVLSPAAATKTRQPLVASISKATNKPDGLAGWFFGFMYEDDYNESFDFDGDENEDIDGLASPWNSLNVAIFASYALTTAATALPVLLIPTIGQDFLEDENAVSGFSSRAASSAVLGIACGKFLNGQVADVLGARRTSSLYSMLLATALLGLAMSRSAASATNACFYVEFFQSVQWPCIIVLLGTHYNPPHHTTQYEKGIFMTSIASRFGALLGIPIFSELLRQSNWRLVCLVGAWIAAIGSSITYLYVSDSPMKANEPQNPLNPNLMQQASTLDPIKRPKRCLVVSIKVMRSVISNNVMPSFKHVLSSGTFWVVALAHTGSSMVRSSTRILGTYFYDTSFGYLSKTRAGGLAIFLSLGTVLGLGIAGNLFARRNERQRKKLVYRLYVVTIVSCYSLALLAIPRLRHFIDSPDLVLFFQIACSLFMGFGISVAYFLIPGLVGSAFGRHRGSYIAYTDGVAFGISSLVWKIVANAVADGNPEGGGWAYGWAAVALLVVLCAVLMVEFMEHYFVRSRPGSGRSGAYETILFV